MIFSPDYRCFNNFTPLRLVASIIACFQPVYDPGNFHLSQSSEPFTLQVTCQKWGDTGRVVCSVAQTMQTDLQFAPPSAITPQEFKV